MPPDVSTDARNAPANTGKSGFPSAISRQSGSMHTPLFRSHSPSITVQPNIIQLAAPLFSPDIAGLFVLSIFRTSFLVIHP